MLSDLDIRFAKHLYAYLVEEQDRQRRNLASGSQIIAEDAAATGMRCARSIGLIAGLEWAVKAIADVEKDLTGKGEPKPQKREAVR